MHTRQGRELLVVEVRRGVAFYRRRGVTVDRVPTDNGAALHRDHARARLPPARDQAPTHPSLPAQTDSKTERFIRTLLSGWAYGATYR